MKVDIRIYVTGADGAASRLPRSASFDDDSINAGSEHEKKNNLTSVLTHSSVTVTEGRPDLSLLLRQEAETSTGRMSVSGQ